MADDNRILDCGHKPSPHSEYTTGTAHYSDNREICWDCSYEQEKEELITADKYIAYLSVEYPYTLTTWPGRHLANVTYAFKGKHNIGGYLYRFRAVDVHGQHWYGTSTGPGMCAHMRKNKRQPRLSAAFIQ